MKKFTFAAIAAVAAIMISSCGNGTPKANLKSDIDTMSYAIGMAQTQGLKEYLVGSLDVDTTYMAEFVKGDRLTVEIEPVGGGVLDAPSPAAGDTDSSLRSE